jgi:hypothetical protein
VGSRENAAATGDDPDSATRSRLHIAEGPARGALETRIVHGVGQELIFSVNGHWRRMRVFKPKGPLLKEMVADTVTKLEARGWDIIPVHATEPPGPVDKDRRK